MHRAARRSALGMRGISTLAASAALAASPALADGHEEMGDDADPREAITQFMQAFNAQAAEAMRAFVVEGAIVTVIEEREGEDRSRTLALDDLISTIAASPADLEEPIGGIAVLRSGPVASAMASFEFLIDGQRSHCGKNIYSLIRVDGEWKITSIAYSHIEDDCGEAEDQ